eukprot:TRINITY_DN112010_c0_g1_i1.p1 TRINITY_DN112010_c0_g1~~TRINITY_DN112010_c0_g1_i1.p1  ORF type:complete len:519 (-),score=101.55 TRINITY_DN112010_c0_g1_i1:94-1650(-)
MVYFLSPTWRWPAILLLALTAGFADAEDILAEKERKVAEAWKALRQAEEELAAARQDSMADKEATMPAPWASKGSVLKSVCNARIRTANHSQASGYLMKEHAARAPFYIILAERSFKAGLKQLKKIDKTNSDPFIKQYEGMNQLVAAVDLDPENPAIWLEAGKTAVKLESLANEGLPHSMAFLSHACRLDPKLVDEVHTWTSSPEKDKDSQHKSVERSKKEIKSWIQKQIKAGKVAKVRVKLSSLESGICHLEPGHAKPLSFENKIKTGRVGAALAATKVMPVFPTYLTKINVREHMPEGWAERLSKLAIAKYTKFGEQFPGIDPNDLNDKFFSAQYTNGDVLKSSEAHSMWPELYRDSKDFPLLVDLMHGALYAFLEKTGVPLRGTDEKQYDLSLWSAVYPGNGGRHGYHVHQSSIASCVLYLQTAGATTPITFLDPRGSPPTDDYEQHEKQRDYEPKAPFHNPEYFFPESGDIVCFPSWLVHNVPAHWEDAHRVAFPANLQGKSDLDAWHRTASII